MFKLKYMIKFLSSKHVSIISILTFFSIFWLLYNGIIRPKDPKQSHLMGHCVFNIPNKLKIFFPIMAKRFKNIFSFEKCLDMWSLSHLFIYFISGLFIPGEYTFIIIFSILCEIFEFFGGYRAKLSDIFVNFAGYYLGSNISISIIRKYGETMNNNKHLTIYSIPLLIILLFLLVFVRKKEWI
jgi:hypothetical protein